MIKYLFAISPLLITSSALADSALYPFESGRSVLSAHMSSSNQDNCDHMDGCDNGPDYAPRIPNTLGRACLEKIYSALQLECQDSLKGYTNDLPECDGIKLGSGRIEASMNGDLVFKFGVDLETRIYFVTVHDVRTCNFELDGQAPSHD